MFLPSEPPPPNTRMKSLTVISLLAVASNLSFGYTTSIFNINMLAPTELPVVDAAGIPIPFAGGSVAAGYFDSLDDGDLGITDFSVLISDFQQFGGDDSEVGLSGGPGLAGLFSVQFDAPIPFPGNEFTGESVYVMIGDGPTLETSTGLAVYKTVEQFGSENAVGLGVVQGFINGGELLVGESGGGVSIAIFDFDDSIKLASGPIPEPSVSLLASLFGLLTLKCRKRQIFLA